MNQRDFMQLCGQFKQNPMQVLSKRYSIPENLNNPNEIIQHLLNTGQVTQAQVNQAMQMRNNPIFSQFFR